MIPVHRKMEDVMKFDVKTCRIISKQKIATDTYDFTLFAGELAQIAQPGQFVHIQVPGKTLRRQIGRASCRERV